MCMLRVKLCFSSSPLKKNKKKKTSNWRRMEMYIMFNTLHFFLAALFWLLSKIPPTWTPFISALLNIQIKKRNLPRCCRNHLPLLALHSPRVMLFCNLMCEAQQGSVADYGPESRLGWIQDGCRGQTFQMLPNIYAPDHVRSLEYLDFHKDESVYPSREGERFLFRMCCFPTEEPALNSFLSLEELPQQLRCRLKDSRFCLQSFVVPF